ERLAKDAHFAMIGRIEQEKPLAGEAVRKPLVFGEGYAVFVDGQSRVSLRSITPKLDDELSAWTCHGLNFLRDSAYTSPLTARSPHASAPCWKTSSRQTDDQKGNG